MIRSTGIFENFIHENLGIKIDSESKTYTGSKIKVLLEKYELSHVDELAEMYKKDTTSKFRDELITAITNNETLFFRDPLYFEALNQHMIQEILERHNTAGAHGPIEIWSAPCSFGQEPYSIAMSILEHYPHIHDRLRIEASDICKRALEYGQAGVYNEFEISRGLPDSCRKYFTQNGENYVVDDRSRYKVSFTQKNILKADYRERFDIIFCRNMSIYFSEEKKQELFDNLYRALKPDGYLVLGATEGLMLRSNNVIQRNFKDISYYQLKPSRITLF